MLRMYGGFAALLLAGTVAAQARLPVSLVLSRTTWPDAEKALTGDSVVLLPVGGGAVEHGPQLPLGTDQVLAEEVSNAVQRRVSVVVAPTLTYHAYGTFADYPGSTSLTAATARDMTVDLVRSLAHHGPRRFYAIAIDAGPLPALAAAARVLSGDGILFGYLDAVSRIGSGESGPIANAHAGNAETSLMLFLAPASVDMTKAAKAFPAGTGRLTRVQDGAGLYSTSGIVGDATAATPEQGQRDFDALVAGALDDVGKIRAAALPVARALPPPAPAGRGAAGAAAARTTAGKCEPGEERSIRLVGDRFGSAWRDRDAGEIARLFTGFGDIRHPDGSIERGQDVIRENRTTLFATKAYQDSQHFVTLTDIRCLPGTAALADGKWELRDVIGSDGKHTTYNGWCTLVLLKSGENWSIEAWRYTLNPPPDAPLPPNFLKTPGFIGRGGGG